MQMIEAMWELTGERLGWFYCRKWGDVPDGAIVTLRFEGDDDDGYHWVTKEVETGRVLCPIKGSCEFEDDSTARVCHYLGRHGSGVPR